MGAVQLHMPIACWTHPGGRTHEAGPVEGRCMAHTYVLRISAEACRDQVLKFIFKAADTNSVMMGCTLPQALQQAPLDAAILNLSPTIAAAHSSWNTRRLYRPALAMDHAIPAISSGANAAPVAPPGWDGLLADTSADCTAASSASQTP